MFAHFGVNTFSDREWGDGKENPASFNPTAFDARQWARAAKDAGFGLIVLTAKHHDGFCLWPSQYTEHSVKNSPWRDGKGDVVKEVSEACREIGLKFGVYLSPWDRHEPCYGDSPRYNEHYRKQMTELLTNYGEISMVWFDGACGEGPNGKKQVYDWPSFTDLVRKLQPNAVMFSDAGPDVRWVGNESGLAKETNWCLFNRSKVTVGGSDISSLGTGDPLGLDWIPAECDVSIRPGWFHHDSENGKVKSVKDLMEIYFQSVGQNASLHLNVPPDRRGRFHENDVARLKEFNDLLTRAFSVDYAKGRKVVASNVRAKDKAFAARACTDGNWNTYWAADDGVTSATLEIDLGRTATFNCVLLQEYIPLGQRVSKFHVEGRVGGEWQRLGQGTTVGYKRLLRIPETKASKVRVIIDEARACPTISTLGVFQVPKY